MNAQLAPVSQDSIGIIASMATHYGMQKEAFLQTVKKTVMPSGKDVSNEQLAQFFLVAREHNLNPFTKEIFAFPAGAGIQPVVSIDGWMKLINSHPQFDGMEFSDSFDEKGVLTAVTCKIFRKDRGHPISVTEYMAECLRATDTWKKWPARMLRHKAAIQCARYAFGFAGIMEQDEAERIIDINPQPTNVPPANLIGDERKKRHDDAVEQYQGSLEAIRQAIQKDDGYTAKECWDEIPSSAQMDLWLAPSKGGWFTTEERKYIKEKLPAQKEEIETL